VLALVLTETAAVSQSPAAYGVAMELLDACRRAHGHDVIFVGRPLAAGYPGGSSLIPTRVETALRGISAKTVSVSWLGDSMLQPDESYLMYGHSNPGGSILELQHYLPVKSDRARKALQFYASAMPKPGYVTLLGVVEVGRHPDVERSLPLTGLRIRLRSDGFAKDIFTENNGTFSAAGTPPGRLELTPFLPESLKVFDIKTLTYTADADECVPEVLFVVPRD